MNTRSLLVVLVLFCSLISPSLSGDCSGLKIIKDQVSGEFGDGLGVYLPRIQCTWIIYAPEGSYITLIFSSFNTECGWDHLYVYDGDTYESPLLASLSGNILPKPIMSTGNATLIHFYSDQNQVYDGFLIRYIVSPCYLGCSGRGQCNNSTLQCQCQESFFGDGCQHQTCTDCSKNGVCTNGTCICSEGFTGPSCLQTVTSASWKTLETKSNYPITSSPSVYVPELDEAFFFGGYTFSGFMDRLISYSFSINTWIEYPFIGNWPSARSDHSFTYANGNLYLFGGKGENNTYFNEMWIFDPQAKTWSLIEPINNPPLPTCCHEAIYLESKKSIMIFGGHTIESGISHEFYYFNIDTNEWSLIVPLGYVRPIMYPSLVYDPKLERVLIFGGVIISSNGVAPTNNLYEFLISSETFRTVSTFGKVPQASFQSSAVVMGDLMVVFGGTSGCYSSSTFALNMLCNNWITLEISLDEIDYDVGRFGHSSISRNNSLYVFGGFSGIVLSDVLELNHDKCWWNSNQISCLKVPSCEWINNGCIEILTSENQMRRNVTSFDLTPNTELCFTCSFFPNQKECNSVGTLNSCTWCEIQSKCIDSTLSLSCDIDDTCQENKNCSSCNENESCKWCSSKQTCIARNSTLSGCPDELRRCTNDCLSLNTCSNCTQNSECSWCSYSKQCVSNDINCALNQDLKISVCLPRCDTKKTCSSCTSDNSCMWCSNLNLCFDSNSYTTSFPYGQCSSWNYGSGDCKVCEDNKKCSTCLSNPLCSWCYGNQTTNGTCTSSPLIGDDKFFCPSGNYSITSISCNVGNVGCDCNGHSDTCDANGCTNCKDRTANGNKKQCENCLDSSYIGSPVDGGVCWYRVLLDISQNVSVAANEVLYMRTVGSTSLKSIILKITTKGEGTIYISSNNPKPSFLSYQYSMDLSNNEVELTLRSEYQEIYFGVVGKTSLSMLFIITSGDSNSPGTNVQNGISLLYYLIIFFMSLFGFLFILTLGIRVREYYMRRQQQVEQENVEMCATRSFHSVTLINEGNHPLKHPLFIDETTIEGVKILTVLIKNPSPSPDDMSVSFGHVLSKKE